MGPGAKSTITVTITGAGAHDGSDLVVGLFQAGEDPDAVPPSGGFIVEISGGTASDQIRNLGSGDIMEFDDGSTYALRIYIDENDNVEPNAGEYLYNDDPKTVTIDGDIQVDTLYPDDFTQILLVD